MKTYDVFLQAVYELNVTVTASSIKEAFSSAKTKIIKWNIPCNDLDIIVTGILHSKTGTSVEDEKDA